MEFLCPKKIAASAFLIVVITSLAGCATPGAPKLRTDSSDGQGDVIAGCQNVSKQYRVEKYNSEYYLTTWGSAWSEGKLEGTQKALEKNQSSESALLSMLFNGSASKQNSFNQFGSPATKGWYEKVNELPEKPSPYCRKYDASFNKVSSIVANVIKKLPHKIIEQDVKLGIFRTDFKESSHRAARWRDSYLVFVDAKDDNHSIVRIFRYVYISRSAKGDEQVFNQATSVGYNEAWLMTQIADKLGNLGNLGKNE